MPLRTTLIGSFPKPSYLPIPDWFRNPDMNTNMTTYNKLSKTELEDVCRTALNDVIKQQCDVGIDVITDGELQREAYYLHLCRHIQGFDFENLAMKGIRNNACQMATPVISGKLKGGETFAWKEWKAAQALSQKPVKYTIPGPMTILNSVTNSYYDNDRAASEDLIPIINAEILDLVKNGCQYVQLDEPVLVRNTDVALEYALAHAQRCFDGVGAGVTKIIHICCGYPNYLDETNYLKADPNCYQILAEKLDQSIFDCVSLEDAHRHNDLSLFKKFETTTLIVGVVQVASSRVETFEEVFSRVEELLGVVPRGRLILAPDCGLGFLVDDQMRNEKLKVMVKVANKF